jgi:hypothetical protein
MLLSQHIAIWLERKLLCRTRGLEEIFFWQQYSNLAITLYLFQIIFTQEKMIQRLNNFVRNLQQQLVQCRGNNRTVNRSGTSLTSYISEIQMLQMMDD